MKNCHLSAISSSPEASQQSIPESLQSFKDTPEEKTGTIPGSVTATAVTLSLRLQQVNVSGCETYRAYRSKKTKEHTARQNDPNKWKSTSLD